MGVEVEEIITCIDCGEPAHLLSYPREEDDWQPGDIVSYRCTGCGDRWDIELPEE
jgi:DNA-directed RNA polymerase subunit RPC12/RpoP